MDTTASVQFLWNAGAISVLVFVALRVLNEFMNLVFRRGGKNSAKDGLTSYVTERVISGDLGCKWENRDEIVRFQGSLEKNTEALDRLNKNIDKLCEHTRRNR